VVGGTARKEIIKERQDRGGSNQLNQGETIQYNENNEGNKDNKKMNEWNKGNKRVNGVAMEELSATACSFVHLTPSKLIDAAETSSHTFCATSAAAMNVSCNRDILVEKIQEQTIGEACCLV
jgi:hypothetical protein